MIEELEKIQFPADEDEFEESVAEMKEQLESILFDENHRFRTEYFLRGYDSAYRICCSWFNEIRSFSSVYDTVDKETYLDMRYLLCDQISEETKKEYEAFLLEKTIPEKITDVERTLYYNLWLLRWSHDVLFGLRPYDESFQEDEYTPENIEQWEQDWVSYDRLELFTLCCEIYDYLYTDENEQFREFARGYIEKQDLATSFFAFFEERK